MEKHLPPPDRKKVEDALKAVASSPDYSPPQRADAADALDRLGYTPEGLHRFIPIPTPQSPNYYIAQYPVTNAQYERFLKSGDFAEERFWTAFPKFSHPKEGKGDELRLETIAYIGDWGDEGWEWYSNPKDFWADKVLKDDAGVIYPRYWHDPRFGIARRGVPVVSITWYEANAYCKWLAEHWGEREEARENPELDPAQLTFRLPTEAEWIAAASPPLPVGEGLGVRGDEPEDRYPWDDGIRAKDDREDITRRANVDESKIGRTTPVWMYPLGVSPRGVWDLGGNVWEWQANFYDKDQYALRGGFWYIGLNLARLAVRRRHDPDGWYSGLGFRVVAAFSTLFSPRRKCNVAERLHCRGHVEEWRGAFLAATLTTSALLSASPSPSIC